MSGPRNREATAPSLWGRIRGRGPAGDEGVALVVAIAVTGLVAILCVTLVTITMAETRGSARERQRAAAVQFAEGEVDTTLAQMQASAPATLPCTGTGQSAVSGPDVIDAATTVTYYNAAGVAVACSETAGPSGAVTSALISTTATSQALAGTAPAQRTVETLVNLTPTVEANGLDKAIYGQAGIRLSNNAKIFGRNGLPNADLYTNGDFTCNNNQDYQGSVYAKGQIYLASTCTIDVDAWAGTGFTANNTGVTVKGDVKVGNGNATFNAQGATVAGTVSVSGTISQEQWRSRNCPAKCTTGASPGMPPDQSIPELPWNATVEAAWRAKGYTVVTVTDCTYSNSANASGPGAWIVNNAATLTQPTVLRTPCEVSMQQNNNRISLKNDLAVFADGGFRIANSLTLQSTNSDVRNLYFIQPYNAPSCGSGISFDNRVTAESTINLLLYSRCDVRTSNNTDLYGQIYAGGNATIDNSLTLYFRSMPVWGLANAPTVRTGYTLDVVYKRETT